MSFAQPMQAHRRAVPLAPLVDILFLLMIFFVTTHSFRAEEQLIDVNLAATRSGAMTEPRRTEIVINVKDDGAILIGSAAYTAGELEAMLRELVADYPEERVIIRGDKRVNYEQIIAVVDAVRAANVRHVFLATVKEGREIGG